MIFNVFVTSKIMSRWVLCLSSKISKSANDFKGDQESKVFFI